jgi:hypothetical protein
MPKRKLVKEHGEHDQNSPKMYKNLVNHHMKRSNFKPAKKWLEVIGKVMVIN